MSRRTLLCSIALLSTIALTGCATPAGPRPLSVDIEPSTASAVGQLADLLPHVVLLHDRMGVAKAATLPADRSVTASTAPSVYLAGDVAYRPADHSIIVFTAAGYHAPANGLVRLGRITAGLPALSECGTVCPVRMMLVP